MEAEEMGLTGMVFSTIAIAAGAVMYWAVTNTQGHGFRLSTVGVILMIVGAIGLAVSATIFSTSRRATGRRGHTYDREVVDSQGVVAAVHEEVH
jgi:apolipoprotein N-acyltransferase